MTSKRFPSDPPSLLSSGLSGFFEEDEAQTLKGPTGEAPASGAADAARAPSPIAEGGIVPVLVPVPIDGPYSYRVGAGESVSPGAVVDVPLGPRTVTGIVWDGAAHGFSEDKKLRTIARVHDAPPVGADIRRFVDWVARYTMSPPGLVARMVARTSPVRDDEKPLFGVKASGHVPERMTPARGRVLALAGDGRGWSKSGLAAAAGVTPGVVDGLTKAGALEKVPLPPRPVADRLDPEHIPDPGKVRHVLTPEQSAAADSLRKSVREAAYSVSLIDGVTGSGKTEVYFEAIAEALKGGRQVLVLVPEIALTAAFLDRFKGRFGGRPSEWHSDVSAKRREQIWRGALNGEVRVVIGARSALFLPFSDLGLIILDEEHDMAYKQEDRAIYNARDMAVVRGHLGNFPVVLASATPSLESIVNANEGRYRRVALPARVANAELPALSAIDMRVDGPEKGRWLAPAMIAAMGETLAMGRQSLLFLNRRGYAPLTLCRQCGFRFQCPSCSTWLVEHRFRNTIECHHCGHQARKPDHCPNCAGADTLIACGPGVERIHEEVRDLFPEARAIVLSSDMFSSTKRLKLELATVERGEVDIVIGTQLVAKGHNFPNLNLVGVVDADLGLAHGDMRAAERTFQMLSQVTGRAGRAGGRSSALLQTYAPDHAVMKALLSGRRDDFYAAETEERRNARLPPFGRLAAFIISANDKNSAMAYGQHLRQTAPGDPHILVLGPSEAPLAVLRGRSRVRLLVQAPKQRDLQGYIRGWLQAAKPPRGGVQLQIDIDPQSFW